MNDTSIRLSLVVDESDEGMRLDRWLTEMLQEAEYEASRSQVQTWLKDQYITGPRLKLRASDGIEAGDQYEIAVPAAKPTMLVGEDLPLAIVYEDKDVVVVNKVRGQVVHPAAGHEAGTVLNALVGRRTQLSGLGGESRPGVVHRIDKDTSGLLVFAKTDVAYARLTEQLRRHTMTRQYEAICHGVLTHDEGTIDAPIGRDKHNRQRMAVVENGKYAVTHFRVEQRYSHYTHLQLQLETGRTHQIRVHLTYIDHPLAGDPVYGPRHTLPIVGQALHARTLGFEHPTSGETLLFEAPLPADMEQLLTGLDQGVF